MISMNELKDYRARWAEVEAVIQEERRSASPELRWKQLNSAYAMAKGLGLLQPDASGTDINILLGNLPFEIEMVERSRVIDVGAIHLRLPTPEDLIIMKAVAHRPKDLDEIHAIAASHPSIDKGRIQFWVEQ